MCAKNEILSLCKVYSFFEEIPEEVLDETDVDSCFYHLSFDISQFHHRRIRVSKRSNKKLSGLELFQFCDSKTQQRYILQKEINIVQENSVFILKFARLPQIFW